MERPSFAGKGVPKCQTVDPDMFTPDPEELGGRGVQKVTREAKEVCKTCDYRYECALWAVIANEVGIWGGLTDNERRSLRRRAFRTRIPLIDLVETITK